MKKSLKIHSSEFYILTVLHFIDQVISIIALDY